jgi:hypothetical protein
MAQRDSLALSKVKGYARARAGSSMHESAYRRRLSASDALRLALF